jgi:hypothetical protein
MQVDFANIIVGFTLQLPTAERHAHCYIDTARTLNQHGQPNRSYTALLAPERQAPQEIRRPSVRAWTGHRPDAIQQLTISWIWHASWHLGIEFPTGLVVV